MVNLTIVPTLRLNRGLSIGTVIFIVEGEKDEFDLIQHIFTKLYGYKTVVPHGKLPDFMMLASISNPHDRIVVIRSDSSSISSIGKFEHHRDKLYENLFLEHGIDSTNSPVFYLWDRDKGNNPARTVASVIRKLSSPYDNGYYENGLLLLSYPCLESYIISAHEDVEYLQDNEHPKKYMKRQPYDIKTIGEAELLHAAARMLNVMKNLGISRFDVDDFLETNLAIFDAEEVAREDGCQLLSLISIALIYLDLIVLE